MKQARFVCLFLCLAAPCFSQSTPVPFIDQPLVPASIAPGHGGFTLTVNGTGFVSGSLVLWNGSPRTTKSLAKRIILSNKGSAAASIASVSITGVGATDFTQTNTCGTGVGAGESCFITVTFTPSALGQRAAQVSVYDGGGGSPQRAPLIGTGTP